MTGFCSRQSCTESKGLTSSDPGETCFRVCWSTCSPHNDWTELCLNLCRPSLGLVLVVCLLRRHHLRWLQSAMTHPVNPDGTYLFRGTTQEPCQPSGNIHGPCCYPVVCKNRRQITCQQAWYISMNPHWCKESPEHFVLYSTVHVLLSLTKVKD